MAEFKLEILSSREESATNSTCYMCESSLEKYMNSIPERYRDYDVQRGIITNLYLDRLTETIMEGKLIPPIVLIAEKHNQNPTDEFIIEDGGYKILDGLQRTYRINSVYNALQIFINELSKGVDFTEITKFKLSKTYKEELERKETSATVLWSIKTIAREKDYSLEYLKDMFSNYSQWFEVWSGLEKSEQINKMLILNAGHKPMDIKHQLELLFLNIIPEDKLSIFTRAKDINSSFFYNKKEVGQLHLSHFISAILAFDARKPISINTKYIKDLQENLDIELEKLKFYFQGDNLEKFIDLMQKLDVLFNDNYTETVINSKDGTSSIKKTGLEWLGRETILIGLFAGFGEYFYTKFEEINKEVDITEVDNLKQIEFLKHMNQIYSKVESNILSFKIQEFNKSKTDSIDVTKVNIGSIFKYTTYNAIYGLLLKDINHIDWKILFKHGTKAYYAC